MHLICLAGRTTPSSLQLSDPSAHPRLVVSSLVTPPPWTGQLPAWSLLSRTRDSVDLAGLSLVLLLARQHCFDFLSRSFLLGVRIKAFTARYPNFMTLQTKLIQNSIENVIRDPIQNPKSNLTSYPKSNSK